MTELTSEIARKLGFNIPSHEGENLSDQLIELASNDEVILQSVAKWFKLGPLKVSMIISEYKKSKKSRDERAVQQIMSEADENNLDSRNNFMPVHDLENPVNNEDESDKNNESQEKASENLSKVNLQVSQISIANPQINLESDNRQAFEQQLEAHKEEENITGAFNVGDKVNCTNIKEFHIIIKKKALQDDKAKIYVKRSDSAKKLIQFECYFSSEHANILFPSIKPELFCKFKMSWKYTLDLLESYTFECIHVHQNHNHKGIPQDQCDNLIECEILPNSIKEQVIQYYIEGFTIRQIQSMLSANDDFKISIEKLYNVVEYYAKTHSENFTFDRIISSECHHTNAIIEFDRALMRFFITDLSRIEMWQKLQDVILIDSTYKVHESFRSAVFILTVDPYGSNYVLAMALTKKETENDYSWIFMNFLKHFQSPQIIFVDRNQAQYNALSDKFRNSKIIFCLWHIQRNLITYLTPLHISWSEFSMTSGQAASEHIF